MVAAKRRKVRLGGGLAWCGIAVFLSVATVNGARGQQKFSTQVAETIPAVLVSDIHFEPFFDPGKVEKLATAPVSAWKGILEAAPSADREASFAALEKKCPTRGEDTSYPLWQSSMRAIRRDGAVAKFATVSGDLISHSFECKFGAAFPHAAPGDYRAFVEKTIDFVIDQLDEAIAGVPVYVALGNNDSDCGDYKLDAHSAFLAAVGEEVAKSFPAAERKGIVDSYAAGGYFSARLPMENARMLVLDDQFMGAKYVTCGGKPDATAGDEQIAWLAAQLAEARGRHERVWVMAHIPPGVDMHSTATHMDEACGAKGPRMYLRSERLADVLEEYGDVVKLAIFAHTHMDEVRVFKAAGGKGVPVKMVSSISPINGNASSFTLARVDAGTAELKDYRVIAASNATGIETSWREEYDWGKTFHESEFSARGVSEEIAGFRADSGATKDTSRDYIKDFFVGVENPLLGMVWPQYACGLENDSAQGFKDCVCTAGSDAKEIGNRE